MAQKKCGLGKCSALKRERSASLGFCSEEVCASKRVHRGYGRRQRGRTRETTAKDTDNCSGGRCLLSTRALTTQKQARLAHHTSTRGSIAGPLKLREGERSDQSECRRKTT